MEHRVKEIKQRVDRLDEAFTLAKTIDLDSTSANRIGSARN
jgi:hypothetical protein